MNHMDIHRSNLLPRIVTPKGDPYEWTVSTRYCPLKEAKRKMNRSKNWTRGSYCSMGLAFFHSRGRLPLIRSTALLQSFFLWMERTVESVLPNECVVLVTNGNGPTISTVLQRQLKKVETVLRSLKKTSTTKPTTNPMAIVFCFSNGCKTANDDRCTFSIL